MSTSAWQTDLIPNITNYIQGTYAGKSVQMLLFDCRNVGNINKTTELRSQGFHDVHCDQPVVQKELMM